jgi:hypothetical protein
MMPPARVLCWLWMGLSLTACGADPKGGSDSADGDDGAEGSDGTDGGSDGGADPWAPDLYCPGDPGGGCADASGALRAGTAVRDISPTCFESWEDLDGNAEWDQATEPFLDCGCDRLCSTDPGYSAADEGEGDGAFQAAWMAGFHSGRPAQGVHDPLTARAFVFEQGDARVALVVLDAVGWFNGPIVETRADLAARGVDLDLLIVSATHTHQGVDTMGLWGRSDGNSGVNPDYMAYVKAQTAEVVEAAIADLRTVGELRVGQVALGDRPEGIPNYLRDGRDPLVIDDRLTAAIFIDSEGQTIGTLAHFGNHPEAMADENLQISSDFVDGLRTGVESGVDWGGSVTPGLGGTTVFVNGSVGGMMTPLGITVNTPDGRALRDYTFEKNAALGGMFAERVIEAVGGGEVVAEPQLRFAQVLTQLPVENWGFQAMFISGIIERETVGWDSTQAIDEDNLPKVETEMAYLRVGPIELVTFPGEVFPELAIGGYDGSKTGSPDLPIVAADNPNPPDLSLAPAAPYYLDRLQGDYRLIVGLGNDELGYIIPPFNFEVHPTEPWFEEAEGDHYEETNSLGINTAPILDAELDRLSVWAYSRWPI